MKFTINQQKILFKGFYQLDELQITHDAFNSQCSIEIKRELFVRSEGVCVLLYDNRLDSVVLVEQFRVGAVVKNDINPWMLEIVAGMIDTNESPEEVASREAIEETGIKIDKLIPIMQYFPSPGGSSERIHLFLGLCDATCALEYAGLSREGEDIKVHIISSANAQKMLATGQIDNAASIISLQWLQLNKHDFNLS